MNPFLSLLVGPLGQAFALMDEYQFLPSLFWKQQELLVLHIVCREAPDKGAQPASPSCYNRHCTSLP